MAQVLAVQPGRRRERRVLGVQAAPHAVAEKEGEAEEKPEKGGAKAEKAEKKEKK